MKDILTEAEAITRLCPLLAPIRLDDGDNEQKLCIASKCMAWRLAHKPASSGEETGYCGAFGLPRFT